MEVILNGEAVVLVDRISSSLQTLIEEQALRGDRIAIERNGSIVPRALWPTTVLSQGDRIEVVHFVGGGVSRS